MGSVIETYNLSRYFDRVVAVDHLNLTVTQGEVFGFLGPNGAGKTTTVRLLNGLLQPSGGSARVLGLDVAAQATAIRRQTGVLTETPSLYEALTARENLLFFGTLYDVPEDALPRRVEAILEAFGLAERADDRVGGYSKGMRQRLAIARALLHEPQLIFLDEPTAGLDPSAARRVREMIQRLSHQQGRTIFMCTHNLAEAQQLCDRVGVIDKGRLRAIGTPQELAQSLWHSIFLEVELRHTASPAVIAALRSLPGVRHHSLQDGKLRLEVGDEEAIPEVVMAIVGAGGRIYALIPQEHTLEEIYFQIQEAGSQEGEKGA
mgnify:FL=1